MSKTEIILSAIKTLEASESVASVRKWEAGRAVRYYLALKHSDRAYKGDAGAKIYIDGGTAELRMEAGKGYMSDGFSADAEAVKALARTLGVVTKEFSTSWDLTVAL